MTNLYITSDLVGIETGGGKVTHYESEALKALGPCAVFGGDFFRTVRGEQPWAHDETFAKAYRSLSYVPGLAHFYSGTWSDTIKQLHRDDWRWKVSYTAAAHSKEESQREYSALGQPFQYPHLTDPDLWRKYLQGYLDADLLIVPSRHSESCMRQYGRVGPIQIIPHGCELQSELCERPDGFVLGYMGAIGPDKGLIYLLMAWEQLGYQDGSLLVFAGRDTQHPYFTSLINEACPTTKRSIIQRGWVDHISSFYNSISCYIQPSVTEGFGCEVLEAFAHARPVLCSKGAGACDVVPSLWTFHPRDTSEMAEKINFAKKLNRESRHAEIGWQDIAKSYTWDKIRAQYIQAWKGLLS